LELLAREFGLAAYAARAHWLHYTTGGRDAVVWATAKSWAKASLDDMIDRWAASLEDEGDASPRVRDTDAACLRLRPTAQELGRFFIPKS
jgi:hypothetical protein